MTTRRLSYRHEVERIVKLPPSMLYEAIAEGDSQADPRQREGCPVYEDEAAAWRAATAPGARWTATVIRPAERRREPVIPPATDNREHRFRDRRSARGTIVGRCVLAVR